MNINYTFYGNSVKSWLIAMAIIISSILLLRLFKMVLMRRIKKYASLSASTIDDFIVSVIESCGMPILYVLAFYIGLTYLNLPVKFTTAIHTGVLAFITYFVLRMVSSFVGYMFNRATSKHEKNEQREKQSKGILLIVQILLWLLGVLFLVDNLGYDITTLVAGLGIGGIAIALAAQTILGDLFSYLVIFFDKPFEIGDFIIVDDKMGVVEYIGIKTTRLRTLGGEQLVCSNTDLTDSRVHNYKRMQERRVLFSFGVTYGTPVNVLSEIPASVKDIIALKDLTRFDRAHFKSFGSFSLDFEVVYYILSPEYNIYMNKQQQINLEIMQLFESRGIEFAFPTQTLFVNNVIRAH